MGHIACMGEMKNSYEIFCWKTCKAETVQKPRHRWEANITMDQRGIGWKLWTGFMWLRLGTSGVLL